MSCKIPSKYKYLIDAGHGGLVDGKYVTPGKRSPKFDSGYVLYEGVNNRDNMHRLITALQLIGIDCIDIVNSNCDISLPRRVEAANIEGKKKPCVYISIHSDAAGDGISWHPASGISVYTSKGQTKSDIFASLVIDELESQFKDSVKWRKDTTDKDEDKEENFYVLANTTMPAILIEAGFHTNQVEAARMLTEEWKDKLITAIVNAILKYEKI